MSSENSVMQQFDAFAKILEPELSTAERLQVVAAVVDLLRIPLSSTAAAALAQLLLELPAVPWENLQFSLSAALRNPKYVTLVQSSGVSATKTPAVLLQAVVVLLDFLQGGAEVSEEIFAAIVASAAEAAVDASPAVLPVQAPAEFVSDALFARVFSPVKIDAQRLLSVGVDPVLFRGELPGATLGPDIRGLVFSAPNTSPQVLLETGEVLPTTDGALNVATMTAADIADFPLALATAANVLTFNSALPLTVVGTITAPHVAVSAAPASVATLEQVFLSGRDSINMGATGPSGATARFPVPGTDLTIVIDARFSPRGPYATSRLVREPAGVEVVLMRNDTLRLFTAVGVYLFPTTAHGLISLTAFS